jgi:hypothetical protein
MVGIQDRAIAEAEAQGDAERAENEKSNWQRLALKKQWPALWGRLRSAIKIACETRSGHLHFYVRPMNEVVVERMGVRNHPTLRLIQRPYLGQVAFSCGGDSGYYSFDLNGENVAIICDPHGKPFSSADEAAEEILSRLFPEAGGSLRQS